MVRNIFITCVFILFTTICLAQHKVEKKFDNGKLEQSGYLTKDGLRDSTWLQYNRNGIVIAEAYYKSGVKVGNWKTYYDNGKLMFDIPYYNGIKKGEACQFDESGTIVATKIY